MVYQNELEGESITARRLSGFKRFSLFLPHDLPRGYGAFKKSTLESANRLLCNDESRLNRWEFMALSNEGFYLRPSENKIVKAKWWGNENKKEMSTDAFGIVVTLFAFYSLIEATEHDDVLDHFYKLKSFANRHPEASAIRRVIDAL